MSAAGPNDQCIIFNISTVHNVKFGASSTCFWSSRMLYFILSASVINICSDSYAKLVLVLGTVLTILFLFYTEYAWWLQLANFHI